jgi:protein involved in polysaccharide export with SLBB domain
MKYSLIFFVLGVTLLSYSQNLPSPLNPVQARQFSQQASDQQLMGFIIQAKNAGYTLTEVKSRFRSQGASTEELEKLERLWEDSGENIEASENNTENIRSNFGINPLLEDDNIESSYKENRNQGYSMRFGSSFFDSKKLTNVNVPELYLATPLDYQLGPGDDLLIELYGASEESYPIQIGRNGTIKIDGLPPIYLSGLSFSEAKQRLISRFSEIYMGLMASEKSKSKVYLEVSLRNARSVVVNITGQVVRPGTYTLSAFTSIINALYAAGGPNNVGSYRAVSVFRAGELISQIDLYEFFAGRKINSIYLQDQDIIHVPALEAQVTLNGSFKIPGLFELKEEETLADIVRFSGGFLSNAYKDRVSLSRISNFKRYLINVPMTKANSFELMDGDVLESRLVQGLVENSVFIEGAVYLPGAYSLANISTIKDLIDFAGGLTPAAVFGQTILYRKENGVEKSIVPINLNEETDKSARLIEGDRLLIPEESQLYNSGTIRIQGEVNRPGIFEFKKGMSISDALIIAKGFTSNANKAEVSIYENYLKEKNYYTQTKIVNFNDNLTTENNVLLNENSLIVVRSDPNKRYVEEVYISGQVLNQGNYGLKGNDYRIYDLIKDSGGFLNEAYLKGISVKRTLSEQEKSDTEVIRASLIEGLDSSFEKDSDMSDIEDKKSEVEKVFNNESIIIGIDGERLMASGGNDFRENIILKKGDSINVPKFDNTITVIGEIQKRSMLVFNKKINIKKAIRVSGGYNENARRSRVYVVYKNGTIKSRQRFLTFLSLDPKLEPGSTVIVPEKLVRNSGSRSLSEIVGLTSSLATLVLLIQQLGL